MVNSDDILNNVLLALSIPVLLVLLVMYFIWSKPVIDACHAKGGNIIRIEGRDKCIDTSVLKEIK